jgi:uncharacterized protein (DUF488 family)
MACCFYTIGHPTRPIGEFVDLLQDADVKLVADVRTVPRSRTNPQYNKDVLPGALSPFNIDYRHFASLGGLRGKARTVPPETNAFWRNASFRNFADYAMSDAFRTGLAGLLQAGAGQSCAIMCAETLWWRCHRRIIADYLIALHHKLFHILAHGHTDLAQLTPAARPGPSGTLIYPDEGPADATLL